MNAYAVTHGNVIIILILLKNKMYAVYIISMA